MKSDKQEIVSYTDSKPPCYTFKFQGRWYWQQRELGGKNLQTLTDHDSDERKSEGFQVDDVAPAASVDIT